MMNYFYPEQQIQFQKNFLEPAKKFANYFSKEDIDALIEIFQEFDQDADRALDTKQLVNCFFFFFFLVDL